MRDWPRTLRPASFRGASFFVESDHIETGRRLVVHEFPHRDTPYIEDLGRKANKIQVTAYVLGDSADGAEKALRGACERRGAGQLILPIDRLRAHCDDCKRDFARDKLGYIAFSLSFVRDGDPSGPFPAGFLSDLVRRGALALTGPLSSLFLSQFSTFGLAGFLRDGAALLVQDVASLTDVLARGLDLDPLRAADIFRDIRTMYSTAMDLVDIGARGDRLGGSFFVQEAESRLVPTLVTFYCDILSDLRESSPPFEFAQALEPLLTYDAPLEGPPTTPSRRREAQNIAAIVLVVRTAAIGQYAAAVVSRRYTSRREAIQARADAAERFDALLALLAGWQSHALYVAVDELRGQTAEHLSRTVADLAPVLTVGSDISMPSLWWANRLYGDAARAQELAARNGVKHPSFMPTEFEALAR